MLKDNMEDMERDINDVLGTSYPSAGKRIFKRILIWLLIIAAAVAAFLYYREHSKVPPVEYRTQSAVEGDLTITVSATGTLEPTNQVDVGSELSGIVATVGVDYNDRVTVGQVLAKLETSKLEADVMKSKAALDSAKSRVMQAEATLTETGRNLDRIKHARALTNNKAPSQEVLDTAQASYQRAKADLMSAKAAVSEAQATLDYDRADLSKSVIRSPINGVVLTRSIDPGQTMAAALQAPVLFTLAEDLTQMELHVDVDEADVSLVKDGQKATFTVDAYPDRSFPAVIRQVRFGPTTTDGVVTYETILSVDNSELLLRPGMTASADITVNSIKKALLVPNAAIRFTPPLSETVKSDEKPSGSILSRLFPRPPHSRSSQKHNSNDDKESKKGQSIWRVGKDGRISELRIETGETDGTMTEVLSGDLKPGAKLAVDTVSESKR